MSVVGYAILGVIGFVLWWLLVDYSTDWHIKKHEKKYHQKEK